MNATQVLNLSASPKSLECKVVDINGTQYQMKNPDELGMLDLAWIERSQPRITELGQRDDPSAEDSEEFSRLLRRYCKIFLVAGDDVQNSLTDIHRIQILQFLTGKTAQAESVGTRKAARKGHS